MREVKKFDDRDICLSYHYYYNNKKMDKKKITISRKLQAWKLSGEIKNKGRHNNKICLWL